MHMGPGVSATGMGSCCMVLAWHGEETSLRRAVNRKDSMIVVIESMVVKTLETIKGEPAHLGRLRYATNYPL